MAPRSQDSLSPSPVARRLDSWKEIAAYLRRDVTTVRRWEKREGLPVYRHQHDRLGSVYGYTAEIDRWCEKRRISPSSDGPVAEGTQLRAQPVQPRSRRPFWRAAAAVLIVLGLGAAAIPLLKPPGAGDAAVKPIRIALVPPEGARVHSLALSPDGDQVAFAASTGPGPARLWLRRLDSVTARELRGTDGASYPFWSPDSQHLGFFADGRLKTIALAAGDVRDVCAAPGGLGGTWNELGTILFAPGNDHALFAVPAAGGHARQVTTLDGSHLGGHTWPEFLPDGRRFLFSDVSIGRDRHGIYVGDLETGQTTKVVSVYSSASYSSDGHLISVDESDRLVARRFDLETLAVGASPVHVADHVLHHYEQGHKVDFSVSRSGLLAIRSTPIDLRRLVWVDREGRELGSLGQPAQYSNPTVSPDGRSAIATILEPPDTGDASLWQFDVASGTRTRLTAESRLDFAPVWSPGADRVVFASVRDRRFGVYQRDLAGGAIEEIAVPPGVRRLMSVPESWSGDGRYLTYSTLESATGSDLWLMEIGSSRPPFALLATRHNEGQSQISPDGRFLAYVSDESGRFEVYVQTFPDGRNKWQVSTGGANDPRWRGDGRELFYIAPDGQLMALDVGRGPGLALGVPRPLFNTGIEVLWNDMRNHYDVAPDGRRFLVVVPHKDLRAVPFAVVFRWRSGAPSSSP
ncbi:MAG TPA: hypothetical protein VLD67_10175 [Vicinamibacterales bacterium]|nr:hypothetical protein [Vicinamibacterales bacterium]